MNQQQELQQLEEQQQQHLSDVLFLLSNPEQKKYPNLKCEHQEAKDTANKIIHKSMGRDGVYDPDVINKVILLLQRTHQRRGLNMLRRFADKAFNILCKEDAQRRGLN